MTIGVGLIGYGVAAKVFHRPLIESVDDLKIVGALRHRMAQGERTDLPIVIKLEEFLAVPKLQVAVICTPNHTHFDLARRCLEAGLHVVVDKPVTVTSAEAEELIALAKQRGRILTVFHNRRYDGDFVLVQRLLAEGALGRLVSYESSYDRFRPHLREGAWREQRQPGSGILYDLGPHLIDQAVLLFGWPRAISGRIRQERDGTNADDAFDVVLDYGAIAVSLHARLVAAVPRPRFRLNGTQGSLMIAGLDQQEELLRSGISPLSREWREARTGTATLRVEVDGELKQQEIPNPLGNYRQFYLDLANAIRDNKEPTVSAEAGRDTVRVIEAAIESSSRRHSAFIRVTQ
jgi:scyllo-inositol 2-dehydrogenase (NADP+)